MVISGGPPPSYPTGVEPRPRLPASLIVLAVLLALGVLVGFVALRSSEEDDDSSSPSVSPAATAPAPRAEPLAQWGRAEDPLPLGETAPLGEWSASLLAVDDRGGARVAAANQFNDAPPEGFRYVVVELGAQFLPPAETTVVGVPWLAVEATLLDGAGREYDSNDCQVVLDGEFSDAPDLYAGGLVEGSECFVVPADEVLAALRVDHEQPDGRTAVAWFATDRDTAPPSRPWPPDVPAFQPSAQPEWSRAAPRGWGEPAAVGGWQVSVTGVDLRADDAVAAANQFNDPPPEGFGYAVVDLRIEGGGIEDAASDLVLSFVGPDHRVLPDFRCGAALGTGSLSLDPVVAEGRVEGRVCVLAPVDQLDSPAAALRVTSFFSDDEAWFATRPSR